MTEACKSEYFRQERKDVEAVVPKDAMRILDVGCGEGILGRRLLDNGASEVVGIEFTPDACEKAKENLTSVICGDIEEIDLSFDEQYFDCMIFADILEHLKDPLLTLKKLTKNLSDSGVVVASIPNVRYYGIINMLAQGRWKYADFGILDRTHLRFFTRKEIETLFTDAGFEITGMTDNIDPAYNRLSDPFSGEITFGRVTLRGLTPDEIRDLFVVQYIIRAQKTGYELHKINMAVNTAIKCEKLEEAKQTIENYLELHPVDMDMLYKHAGICFKLGFNDEALESLQKILIFYPAKEKAINLRDTINRIETKNVYQKDSKQMQNTVLSEKKNERERRKVAVVRGANLNKWEMQNYEPLLDSYDITAYTTSETYFDIRDIKLQVVRLPFHDQGLLMEMQGLKDHLSDKDIVFSADITYKFSAQAVRAKQEFGNKVICLEWENIPFNYEEYDVVREIKELVRNGADHFIAVTGRAKEALMLEGVPEEKIDVIPMGVDLNIFKPRKNDIVKDRSELGINSNETVVLFIGRMVWEKGIYDLLHAAARICRDSQMNEHRVKFLIVGKGPELQGVHERAEKLGITNRITFVEEYPYQDMYKLHNLADIFVLPSISTPKWQEQFGMVLIESMACGTPLISTLSGSIPEVVGDAGILVQPNDHLSLYNAIKKLVLDKNIREQTGDKALTRAESLFDSRKTAEKVKIVFEKVLSGTTKSGRF